MPSSGDLPDPGVNRTSVMSPALAGRFLTTSATWEAHQKLVETPKIGGLQSVVWQMPLLPDGAEDVGNKAS